MWRPPLEWHPEVSNRHQRKEGLQVPKTSSLPGAPYASNPHPRNVSLQNKKTYNTMHCNKLNLKKEKSLLNNLACTDQLF